MEAMRKRYRGVMVGAAIGDALGADYEFMDAKSIELAVGARFVWDYPDTVGHPTDDTQLSIIVGKALVEATSFGEIPAILATGLGDWYVNPMGGHRAPGTACMRAARALREAPESWVTRRYEDELGCGAIMRTHPVALRFFGSSERIALATAGQAYMTHGHPLSTAACELWSSLICAALAGTITSAWSIRDALRAAADTETKRALIALIREETTAQTLGDIYLDHPGWRADDAFIAATSTVLALGFRTTPIYAVARAVVQGGDSDSVASMVGALIGAMYGIEVFGEDRVNRLEWSEILIDLADKLYIANMGDGGAI